MKFDDLALGATFRQPPIAEDETVYVKIDDDRFKAFGTYERIHKAHPRMDVVEA